MVIFFFCRIGSAMVIMSVWTGQMKLTVQSAHNSSGVQMEDASPHTSDVTAGRIVVVTTQTRNIALPVRCTSLSV